MRYWVYINDKVLEKPFEEGELSSIPGFTGDTLVCKEKPAPGETQEWVPANTLIESYKQPAPPPPPTPQVISKFAHKEDTFTKEPKNTILSSNIFGSSKDNDTDNKDTQETEANLGKTENILPQEQAALDEDFFDNQTTEIVSIDDFKDVDVDNNDELLDSESEEEILKTAIKSLITKRRPKKRAHVQAVDITNNKNIDLSDLNEEEEKGPESKNANPKEEQAQEIEEQATEPQEEQEKEPVQEEPVQEEAQEKTQEESSVVKTDFSDTDLTPLGTNEDTLNHIIDEKITPEESLETTEEPKEENKTEGETPSNQVDIPEENEQTQEPLNEEDFVPEEEISLEDEDLLIDHLRPTEKEEVLDIKEEATDTDKEILEAIEKEAAEDKELEKAEETLKEVFDSEAVLIGEASTEENKTEENKKEEIPLQKPNNILEENKENTEEKKITSLEELTGANIEESLSKEEEKKEEEEGFIPTEIHPDIIVEEVDEKTKRKLAEEEAKKKAQQAAQAKQEEGDDNFLNTFSSDIETVFLDQPTAFISDYIPPEETREKGPAENPFGTPNTDEKEEILDIKSDQGQHQVAIQNVRRLKPAAIKTVPMVDGEQADPFSKTQIRNIEVAEEAMAKVEKKNEIINLIKTFALIGVFLIMIIAFIGLVAQIGILPKDFSPLHAMLAPKKVEKTKRVKKTKEEKKAIMQNLALQDIKDAEVLQINKIIDEVKKYKLNEGITLEEKIKFLHPDEFDNLQWSAALLPEDITYYSVTVSSPTNPEGYTKVNYRFNYNTVKYTVEATTSEAHNLMVNPYVPPQTQQQAQTQAQQPQAQQGQKTAKK